MTTVRGAGASVTGKGYRYRYASFPAPVVQRQRQCAQTTSSVSSNLTRGTPTSLRPALLLRLRVVDDPFGRCDAHTMSMRTETTDKWVRGYVGSTTVVDSRDAVLFWEPEFPVPAYAFPRDDVRADLLRPSTAGRPKQSFYTPKGPVSEWYDVAVDDRVIEHAAWVRDDPAISDRIVLSWEPGVLDRWLEEDEEVIGHPRDPHKRVEALASTRHVQ